MSPRWFQLVLQLLFPQQRVKIQMLRSSQDTRLPKVLRAIDDQFLENYFAKQLGAFKGRGNETNELMRATSELLALKAGGQLYESLADLCHLDAKRATQVNRVEGKLSFHQGINVDVICDVAPERYGREWCVNMGDGTRALRALEPGAGVSTGYLVGVVYPPDVQQWPSEPGTEHPSHITH